ncbi:MULTISPECIES: NADPH-dependent F420 reductase [unclassified Arthrobacter]|uniref:NADPH-dependent F420 reductase n=1 Tax=unclassified Arthrobacter TaxID=235627 RepID=UPI001F491DB6|nr:NAD(P)-binding domain-containing protein [Arthrobacter sp. FW305-BF8]UKA54452.1 NAD(P)-binding domain-containing protein [Arthrobacter sp. FW305-BF8]
MSTIAIMGTGLMASALGKGWTKAGHQVQIGSRSPEAVQSADLGYEPAVVGDYRTALAGSDTVVLAIPFTAVVPFVEEHQEALAGKTIIDISNPFDALPGNELAGAEYTAKALGTTDGLVAAFKDNFAATVNAPGAADGNRPDVKIAGDDDEAKAVVAALAADLNHRVLDCGPLHNARLIDSMVSLMLILDRTYTGFTMKTGWRFTGLTEN